AASAKEKPSAVVLPAHSPEGRGSLVPGRGPRTEPRGVMPKPGHAPRVAVQPTIPANADLNPGKALGHDKVHGQNPVRPLRNHGTRVNHRPPNARAVRPHAAKSHKPKKTPVRPAHKKPPPPPPSPPSGRGGKK